MTSPAAVRPPHPRTPIKPKTGGCAALLTNIKLTRAQLRRIQRRTLRKATPRRRKHRRRNDNDNTAITDRTTRADGISIDDALRLQVQRQKNNKTTGSYRASDIIYDIEHGRLAVEVTADEAAEITTPRPAQVGHHFLTNIT